MISFQEVLMRTVRSIQILCSIIIILLVVGLAFVYVNLEKLTPNIVGAIMTPTREQVNLAVIKLILAGRAGEVYSFYAYEVGDPLKASLYIEAALEGTIRAPVDLVMAIGWWEGGHQVGGVDGPNQNGSYDARPMGLNSYTYKKYSMADLQRVEINIPFGVTHLVSEKQKWGVSWESALSSYNKGSPSGLDYRQIDYVASILRHEWEIDRKFAARFPDTF